MRCFVAVTVGPRITEAVGATVAELRAAADDCGLRISWARADGWHVTLKFLGEITAEQVANVGSVLRDAAATVEAFSVTATGMIVLPRPSSPRVLAVPVADSDGSTDGTEDGTTKDALVRVAAAVDESLVRAGFERERRRFLGHLTIGRVRDPRAGRSGAWKAFAPLVAHVKRRDFGRGRVDSVGLYRSRLEPGGARYQLLEGFELGAAAAQASQARHAKSTPRDR